MKDIQFTKQGKIYVPQQGGREGGGRVVSKYKPNKVEVV